jgi:hypothetical protein
MRSYRYAIAASICLAAACESGQDPASPGIEESGFAAVTVPDVAVNNDIARKEGPAGTFNFAVSGSASMTFPSGTSFTLVDEECKTVGLATAGAPSATVAENTATLPANTQFDSVVTFRFTSTGGLQSGPPVRQGVSTTASATVTPVGNDSGYVLVFHNSATPPPPPPPFLQGRMTGGGAQLAVGDVRITRGFTIHCDITLSNNLEINWPDNKWHITKPLTDAQCIDDPAIDPGHPPAPFDTFIGEGVGELNGEPGSIVRFVFIDNGEPGKTDQAKIQIWSAGGSLVLDLPLSLLDHGNIQAHYDQPHAQKAKK